MLPFQRSWKIKTRVAQLTFNLLSGNNTGRDTNRAGRDASHRSVPKLFFFKKSSPQFVPKLG